MQIVRTPGSARAIARTLARPVGFVPTMGALHAGHLSLIARARAENAAVVASIFVNPLQFGPAEDFGAYPRTFEADADLLARAGVDLLYAPSAERMYPPGFVTSVTTGELAGRFEGEHRPGHFDGVATVVSKLVHAIEPTVLYLGQKDVQQAVVIRRMLADLDMPTSLVVAPTVRDPDGLALSSRNRNLTPTQRAAAPSLHRAIEAVREAVIGGARDTRNVCAAAALLIESPLELEYLAVVDPQTFEEMTVAEAPAIIVGVARAGSTRLLDNATIPGPGGVDPIVTLPSTTRSSSAR